MRIAICLSGQPRTWEKCQPTWQKLINSIKERYEVDGVDIFCHLWDYNTSPHRLIMHEGWDYLTMPSDKISEEEKQRIVSAINPKSYVFETEAVNKKTIKDTRFRNQPHINEHGKTELEWASGQFYSVMYAAHLKKQYEYEHDFRYDVCFRMRCDMYFSEKQIEYFLNNDLTYPEPNTFYSCHTGKDSLQFPFHRLGDVFWYADTVTFNRICEFYRWLPILGKRSFGAHKLTGTEHALYFYAKMLNMEISPLTFDPKICRTQDYLDRKIVAGLEGELGGHEII